MSNEKVNDQDKDESHETGSSKGYCEVNIFGDVYKLVSNEQGFGKLQEVASEVDRQMRLISSKHPDFPKYKIAILVALNVTDSLFSKDAETTKHNPTKELSKQDLAKAKLNETLFQRKEESIIMRIEKLIDDIDQAL